MQEDKWAGIGLEPYCDASTCLFFQYCELRLGLSIVQTLFGCGANSHHLVDSMVALEEVAEEDLVRSRIDLIIPNGEWVDS